MNWMATCEQREEALLRVFYMLVVRFLFAIQAVRDARSLPAASLREGSPAIVESPPSDELRRRVLMLLLAVEIAGRRLMAMYGRTVHELMNRLPGRVVLICKPVDRCAQPAKRLDSS